MSVTLHTSHGDVKVEMFCDLAPSTCEVRLMQRISWAFTVFHVPSPSSQNNPTDGKRCTVQNFLALCASNYYDGTVFHRNVKGPSCPTRSYLSCTSPEVNFAVLMSAVCTQDS